MNPPINSPQRQPSAPAAPYGGDPAPPRRDGSPPDRWFADPPPGAAPVPFWMWNGRMEPAEIRRQIGLMAAAGVESFVIHPREGLEIPYLSEVWFDRVGIALEAARGRGMGVWIYDDMNWPSGYAGGRLLEADPSRFARHLARVRLDVRGGGRGTGRGGEAHYALGPEESVVAAFELGAGGEVRPAAAISAPTATGAPAGGKPGMGDDRRLVFRTAPGVRRLDLYLCRPCSFTVTYRPDLRYTDLLDPEAVRLFIRLTHEEYRRRFGDDFGGSIRGFFTDEPGFYGNLFGNDPETVPWTAVFAEHFRRLKGYDLIPLVGALWEPYVAAAECGDPPPHRVRIDYFDTLATRYRESFFAQLHDWCREHGVALVGHLLCEEDLVLTARSQGDFFRHFRHLDMAGVDLVDRVGEEKAVGLRLGASVARHMDKPGLISETFGIFGWDLSLARMRYTTDWQAVRGLTALIPHAFYYSIEGDRRRECPPSLFYQNTWWSHYPHFQQYAARLLGALSRGRSAARVALFYPIRSVWALLDAGDRGEQRARAVDVAFRGAVLAMEQAQVDFQVLDEEMLSRAVVEEDGVLTLDGCRYRAVVLPWTVDLPEAVAIRLCGFAQTGGLVLALGRRPPARNAGGAGETAGGETVGMAAVEGNGRGSGQRSVACRCFELPDPGPPHPVERGAAWRVLRRLRAIGARVAPGLETAATGAFRRWLGRRREREAGRAAAAPGLEELTAALKTHVDPYLVLDPPDPHIRHLRLELPGPEGGELVFLLNQEDREKRLRLGLQGPGKPLRLDPRNGEAVPLHVWSVDADGRIQAELGFSPRGSILIWLAPGNKGPCCRVEYTDLDEVVSVRCDDRGSAPQVEGIAFSGGQKVTRVVEIIEPRHESVGPAAKSTNPDGGVRCGWRGWVGKMDVKPPKKPLIMDAGWEIDFDGEVGDSALRNQSPGDWSRLGRERFSGTAAYRLGFEVPGVQVPADPALLELGDVRDAARVRVNGSEAGVSLWPPHRLRVEQLLRPGSNELVVEVTNSLANRFDGAARPSGLLGPVRLVFGRRVRMGTGFLKSFHPRIP